MNESAPMGEVPVGHVTHYWTDLGVAGVHLDAPLDVGDHIHVVGHTSDFEQDVRSMELWNHEVGHADEGDDVGVKVAEHARDHDTVYKRTGATQLAQEESEL